MNRVRSADGTSIAFERLGDGRPLVLVCGASCDRVRMRPTAEGLAARFSVVNYDRRGRGDSGDTLPYAVEREVEDLAAVIEAAGGRAAVYGHSSGAGLALHAAAHGLPIDALVLHDAPYSPDDEQQRREAREFAEHLDGLLADGRAGDALEFFFTGVGMPEEMVAEMRRGPGWPPLEALAHTLAYDSAVMGDVDRGGAVAEDLAARVTAPTLVLSGDAGPPWMADVGRQLAGALPRGELRVLEGADHVVSPEVLTPVVADFLAGH